MLWFLTWSCFFHQAAPSALSRPWSHILWLPWKYSTPSVKAGLLSCLFPCWLLISSVNHYHNFVLSISGVEKKKYLCLKIRRLWRFMVSGLLSCILGIETFYEISWMRDNHGSYTFRTHWDPFMDQKLISRTHNYYFIFKLISNVLQQIIQFIIFTIGNEWPFICSLKLSWKSIG